MVGGSKLWGAWVNWGCGHNGGGLNWGRGVSKLEVNWGEGDCGKKKNRKMKFSPATK